GEGAVDGVAAGEESMFVVESAGEPGAEASREDGPTVVAGGAVGHDGPGVPEGGGEGGNEFDGVVEELLGAGFVGHSGLLGSGHSALTSLIPRTKLRGLEGWSDGHLLAS